MIDKDLIRLNEIQRYFTVGTETVKALRSISMSIDRNEFVALMGPSGSGKSTLMNLLGCLQKGACYVGLPAFEAKAMFQLIESERCTLLSPKTSLGPVRVPKREFAGAQIVWFRRACQAQSFVSQDECSRNNGDLLTPHITMQPWFAESSVALGRLQAEAWWLSSMSRRT